MNVEAIITAPLNYHNRFRVVTVRHVETGETFEQQTFTRSDEESLEFARQTFSDKVFECVAKSSDAARLVDYEPEEWQSPVDEREGN